MPWHIVISPFSLLRRHYVAVEANSQVYLFQSWNISCGTFRPQGKYFDWGL